MIWCVSTYIECMPKCETTHSPMSSAQFKNAWYAVPCHCGNGTSLVSDCDIFFLIIFVVNFYINGSVWGLNLEYFLTLKLHFNSWRIRDQLDVTSYYVLFHFFYAQHVSDINTSIIRSLRLFLLLGWYPCSRLQPATWIPPQPSHKRNFNTHRNKNTRPMWWYNKKVAGSWWWVY